MSNGNKDPDQAIRDFKRAPSVLSHVNEGWKGWIMEINPSKIEGNVILILNNRADFDIPDTGFTLGQRVHVTPKPGGYDVVPHKP